MHSPPRCKRPNGESTMRAFMSNKKGADHKQDMKRNAITTPKRGLAWRHAP